MLCSACYVSKTCVLATIIVVCEYNKFVRQCIKSSGKYCSRNYGGSDSVTIGNLVSKVLFRIHELKEQLYKFTALNPHKLKFDMLPIPVAMLLLV